MADDCSRLWHLTDKQLLTHFNLNYPQNLPWKQCTRDKFCTSHHLAKDTTTAGIMPSKLKKQRHSGLSGWQNVPSRKLNQSKISALLSLVELMPCSSNLLATGILIQYFAICTYIPTPLCQDCLNSYWLVAIPNS
jgi:hypothetical protein